MQAMGNNVNIERVARISPDLRIGNGSEIGVNCEVYGPVTIGDYVMMGPEFVFYTRNHRHEVKSDLSFGKQGHADAKSVWIGRRVIFSPKAVRVTIA